MRFRLLSTLLLGLLLFTTCDKSPVKSDFTQPTVNITSPPDGIAVSGIVTITSEVTDNDSVLKADLWVDGDFAGVSDSTDPYSLDWDTAPYDIGSFHTITVRAYDVNGNMKESESISLNVIISFVKTYGVSGNNRGFSVLQTADEGYVIVGYTESQGAGGKDLWILKTDNFGNMIWGKTYGGVYDDEGNSIQETTDGGYIITGYSTLFGSVFNEGIFIWLLKTDMNGDTLWTKTIGISPDNGRSKGYSVQETSNGGYIISGFINYRSALIKTNAVGDTIWTKTWDCHCVGYSVKQTTDGGYVFLNNINVSGGVQYFQIVKTDIVGNETWSHDFYGIAEALGYSVRQTTDGGYIITGGTFPYGGTRWDILLIKMDPQGNVTWNRRHGEGGHPIEIGLDVQQTEDRGFIVTGFKAGNWDLILLKTDASGYSQWNEIFSWGDWPLDSRGCSVKQTTDGGYIVTGYTENHSQSKSELLLIKTDSRGITVSY